MTQRTASRTGARQAGRAARPGVNEVTLRGTVTTAPSVRELPSGTQISTLRMSIRRADTTMTRGSRQVVDWVDLSVWSATLRKRVAAWSTGDEVEVTGALRRRTFRTTAGATSIVEVEVLKARRAHERQSRSAEHG